MVKILFYLYRNVQNILNDPTIMQQIHQMSQTIKKTEQLKNELNIQEQLRQQLLKQQEQEFNQQISQVSFFYFTYLFSS